jgi:large subunit ribosomal protein L21
MYAVIESGGKQYRVELGSEIEVESLTAEAGKTIQIERVLLVADGDETAIGQPTVQGARVSVDVVRHDRGDKIVVFKYQPKARRRVKHGHRQQLTVLRVSDIVLGGRSAAKLAEAERSEREKVEAEAAREADRKAAADRALAARLAKEAEAKQAAEDAEAAKRRPRTGAAGKPSARSADAKPADAKPKGKATGSGATKAGTTKNTATGKAEGGTVRRVQAPLPKPRSAGSTPTTKSTAPSKSSTTGKTSAAGKSTTTSKTSPASKSSTTPRPRSAAKTTKDT